MVKIVNTISALAALFAPSGVQSQFLADWKQTHPIANITEKVETQSLFLNTQRKHP